MTEANSRMARLETDPVLREEAETIRIMTAMYCRGTATARRGAPDGLCPECSAFLAYALKRLACCPYGASKPVCAKCRIHCYRAKEKAQAREVMRHAGPRLAASHPVLSIRHLVKSLTVKAPEKPRNTAAKKRWHDEEGAALDPARALDAALLRASSLPRRAACGCGRAAWRTHPSGREGCGRHAPSRTSSRALCLRMGESRREDRHAKARDGRFDSSCA